MRKQRSLELFALKTQKHISKESKIAGRQFHAREDLGQHGSQMHQQRNLEQHAQKERA